MTAKKPGAKLGRPTKKTPENRDLILRGVRAGLFPETAAGVAHVSSRTLAEWRAEDKDFSQEIDDARAEAEARKVGYIEKQAPNSWKAAAWLLAKANPARFGDKVALTGADGNDLVVRVIRDDPTPQEGAE